MSQRAVRVAPQITEGLAITVRPREDAPLCSRRKVQGETGRGGVLSAVTFHSLFSYESFIDARSCTQNTTSIAAMLHFATVMFWLERRPFRCQCTFFPTEPGEQDATEGPPQTILTAKGRRFVPL